MGKAKLLAAAALILTSGCAFRGDVKRMSVDFNATVADSANELTLLNVLRAKEYRPLHFSSFSLVRGSISMSAGSGFEPTFKGGQTTTKTDIAGKVATDIVEGVDSFLFKPSASFSTGPSFDVSVQDTQEFYQGILTSVPKETIAHYLHQGWRDDLLAYLLVQRVNFRLKNDIVELDDKGVPVRDAKGKARVVLPAGSLVASIEQMPHSEDELLAFKQFVQCYELSAITETPKAVDLASAARLTELKLEDLRHLDGKALTLSKALAASPAAEEAIVQRPRAPYERLKLYLRDRPVEATRADFISASKQGDETPHRTCTRVNKYIPEAPGELHVSEALPAGAPERPEGPSGRYNVDPSSPIGAKLTAARATLEPQVEVELVIRSVEGIFTFLGDYLRTDDDHHHAAGDDRQYPTHVYTVEGKRLFDVSETRTGGRPVVSAQLDGRRYYVIADGNESHKHTMQVIALLQQLVNLQKKSSDKPATQAVRVLD